MRDPSSGGALGGAGQQPHRDPLDDGPARSPAAVSRPVSLHPSLAPFPGPVSVPGFLPTTPLGIPVRVLINF